MEPDAAHSPPITRDGDPVQRADPAGSAVAGPSARRWNLGRDAAAVVLLAGATLLPWNLFFGVGIPGSSPAWFAVLLTVTALAIGSIAAPYAGRADFRTKLGAPYVLFVLGVVGFELYETLIYGDNPGAPGVGPGVWLGAAGAVLASQPVLRGDPQDDIDQRRPWLAGARLVGATSIVLAALSAGFTLYWQTSDAITGLSRAEVFGRSVATIATAAVYSMAALAPVVVGSGWILQRNKGSRLAMIGLGSSTLAAGLLVWIIHVGREIDVYHGIAQVTALTSAVGFEGYLAWAVTGAIFAPLTLRAAVNQKTFDSRTWRQAARKGLLMMTVACAGAAAMRLADLVDTVSLGIHRPIREDVVLVAINLVTAALAWWLRTDRAAVSRAAATVPWAYLILLLFSVSRVVAAIALAQRQPGLSAAADAQPVYGNALAQQLTSTFDVVLCFVALLITAAALIAARRASSASRHGGAQAPRKANSDGAHAIPTPAAPSRAGASAGDDQSATASDDSAPASVKGGVDAVLQASTRRFDAGTTYTGRGASDDDS